MRILIIFTIIFFMLPILILHSESTIDNIFLSNPKWKVINYSYIKELASKFHSTKSAKDFIKICETTNILENNIYDYAETYSVQDVEYGVDLISITLTSYANSLGQNEKYKEGKKVIEYALLINPIYEPAWSSMALILLFLEDYDGALFWANKVLHYKPNPNSEDFWEKISAEARNPTGELQLPPELDVISGYKDIRQTMEMVVQACKQRKIK